MTKCPANEVPKQIKDTMWHFLMIGGQKADIQGLKESVNELCQATMQKNAGQKPHAKKTDIDWNDLDSIMWRIIIQATALALSGRLNELEEKEDE